MQDASSEKKIGLESHKQWRTEVAAHAMAGVLLQRKPLVASNIFNKLKELAISKPYARKRLGRVHEYMGISVRITNRLSVRLQMRTVVLMSLACNRNVDHAIINCNSGKKTP